MTIALAITCLALVGLLANHMRVAARDRAEAADYRRGLAAGHTELVKELERVREEAARERRELYQRIQAPEIAVHEAQLEARRERPYRRRQPIGADDDAAFAARRAERQAERQAAEVDGG